VRAAEALGEALSGSDAAQCIEGCFSMLATRFDSRLGGFGGAPKFPRPAEINLLLVEHLRSSEERGASSAGASTSTSGAPELPLHTGGQTSMLFCSVQQDVPFMQPIKDLHLSSCLPRALCAKRHDVAFSSARQRPQGASTNMYILPGESSTALIGLSTRGYGDEGVLSGRGVAWRRAQEGRAGHG
jgi:hypothetical protein